MGFSEKLFDFPILYKAKRKILNTIGVKFDFPVDEYIKDRYVLDVGCGPGISSFDIRQASRIIGFDINWNAVKAASKNDKKVLQADAEFLPFRNDTFDTVVISGVLHHIPKHARPIFNEIARVAKRYIVMYEPEQSIDIIKRLIKTTWWALSDGGCSYYTRHEWDQILYGYKRLKELHTGRMWENAFYCVIDVSRT
jgi:ubiquinone/menaquinone biosynthesis C-methylase UbiE